MLDNQVIHTEHRDVIHDCSYDYHGQRMATCSSDQTIKVWEQNEKGQWIVSASWKAHSGSIWRLSWANPEFGVVIASASFDRTVSVWEETSEQKPSPSATPGKRWIRRTNLVDSRTSVTDVKFGPKILGLVLATSSSDGIIRIYEAPDIMNLSQWTLQHEIACKVPLSCISWNPSLFRMHLPMLAAASDAATSNEPKVFIFEYSDNRRWVKTETINVSEPVHDISFAPNVGRSYHMLAIASKDVSIFNLKPILEPTTNTSRFEVVKAAQFNDNFCTVWRVTWNITGSILASSGDDGYVRLWRMNYQKIFKCVCSFRPDNSMCTNNPVDTQAAIAFSNSSTTAKFFKKGVGTFGTSSQIQQH